MATGWRDILEEAGRQTATNANDPDALWRMFEEALATSPRREVLELARSLGTKLAEPDRGALALVLAALLDTVEWPAEWERARQPLVRALFELFEDLWPTSADSLSTALNLEEDATFQLGRVALTSAALLLENPGPPSQLKTIARLCGIGHAACFVALEKRLPVHRPGEDSSAARAAASRLEVAYQKYARAARAMNTACGEVLFDGLDLRLSGA